MSRGDFNRRVEEAFSSDDTSRKTLMYRVTREEGLISLQQFGLSRTLPNSLSLLL